MGRPTGRPRLATEKVDGYKTLNQKTIAFLEEYLKTGEKYKSFVSVFGDMSGDQAEVRMRAYFSDSIVKDYIEKRRADIRGNTNLDANYIIEGLMAIVEAHPGDHKTTKALEMLGKMIGIFWEPPSRALPDQLPTNPEEASAMILHMASVGVISETCAKTWIEMLNAKYSVDEKFRINKEINEKLDLLTKRISRRSMQ